MSTPTIDKITDGDLGNSQVREQAGRLAREFDRIVGVFNKALIFKDRQRQRLQAAIHRRQDQIYNNFNKLQTVLKNIEVYDQNLRKINLAIVHMQQKEILLKNKYQTLLHGATREELIEEVESDLAETVTREKLSQRRRLFLDELDKTFTALEQDLLTLETYKTEMLDTQAELIQRRDKAVHLQVVLEEKRRLMLAERKSLEGALEKTLREEKSLIQALRDKLDGLEALLELPEEIDQLLFSLLSSLEASRESRTRPDLTARLLEDAAGEGAAEKEGQAAPDLPG